MSLAILRLAALLAIFACTVLLVQVIATALANRRLRTKGVNRRMEMLRSGQDREAIAQILRSDYASAGKGGSFEKLRRSYSIADVPYRFETAAGFLLAVSAALFAGLLLLTTAMGFAISIGTVVLLLAFVAALGIGLPVLLLVRRAQKRRRRMEEQFPVALDIFTRALRSGHPVPVAIELLTQEMSDPIGSEFGIVADEVSFGADLPDALRELASRWDLPDVDLFAVSLAVQTETGGNLAEILGNLSTVIRERASLFLKVRALSSEGRMSAWMLSVLPVLTFLLLFVANAAFFLDVAGDPIFAWGFGILFLLYLVGVLWLRKMVDLKV